MYKRTNHVANGKNRSLTSQLNEEKQARGGTSVEEAQERAQWPFCHELCPGTPTERKVSYIIDD